MLKPTLARPKPRVVLCLPSKTRRWHPPPRSLRYQGRGRAERGSGVSESPTPLRRPGSAASSCSCPPALRSSVLHRSLVGPFVLVGLSPGVQRGRRCPQDSDHRRLLLPLRSCSVPGFPPAFAVSCSPLDAFRRRPASAPRPPAPTESTAWTAFSSLAPLTVLCQASYDVINPRVGMTYTAHAALYAYAYASQGGASGRWRSCRRPALLRRPCARRGPPRARIARPCARHAIPQRRRRPAPASPARASARAPVS